MKKRIKNEMKQITKKKVSFLNKFHSKLKMKKNKTIQQQKKSKKEKKII